MATATKKKSETVFSKKEAELERKKIIHERFGLLPIDANEDGFYYDGRETINRIKEMRKKGINP